MAIDVELRGHRGPVSASHHGPARTHCPYCVARARTAPIQGNASSNAFVGSLFSTLRFNARSALENGANFREFVYDRGEDAGARDVVDDLLAFAPQAIVFTGKGFYSRVLLPLETRWTGSPRPFYLTGSGIGQEADQFIGHDAARRHRFFAATNLSTTMTNAQLVLHYNRAYPDEPIVRSEAPEPSYDAFYVLAYALYALGDQAISGPALSGAIDRVLPPGHAVDVGPNAIFEAFGALRSNASSGHIDLNGAIGSLDFDRATGEAPIDYAIVCPGVDDHGAATLSVDSGLVYDARLKKLIGTLHCR